MSAGLADGENPPPPLFLPTVYEGTCGRQRLGEPSWRPVPNPFEAAGRLQGGIDL